MIQRMRWIVLALLTLCVCGWLWTRLRMHRESLPYYDSFSSKEAAEWLPFGGQWQMRNGTVVNRSDEDGAKLVTGSHSWKDYALDTDVKLIGQNGNVGVIVRVNDEEPGTDAYSGYYVGLRAGDSAFVVGRADHGWLGGRPTSMQGGVQTGVWYHLRVVVVGCQLAAQARNLESGKTSYLSFEEQGCERTGRIGLRSIGMGGAWRHIEVVSAALPQLTEIASHAAFVSHPVYPTREDDYNKMLEELFRSSDNSLSSDLAPPPPHLPEHKITPITTAKLASSPGETLVVRGVVILTSPLYIQDSTGGAIEVRAQQSSDLNLGDELQVQGTLMSSGPSSFFHADHLRVVGERTPVAPAAITSTQAADGSFDGRLVQLSGTLESATATRDEIALRMSDGEQTFEVNGSGLLSPRELLNGSQGSVLRVRGICMEGPPRDNRGGAFTIMIRSVDDVELLSGPPWWSPHLIVRYITLLLALVAFGVYVYLRAERNTMRAIMSERERLAHEMHDTLAQSFAGVGFQLQGVRNSLRAGTLTLPAAIGKLDVACAMVTQTHREASAEIAALHPDQDRGKDLLTVLERATHAIVEESLPPMNFLREGVPRSLSLVVRDAFFQVGREAITNILRHSNASEITVRLHYQLSHFLLEVTDNGCGFNYDEHSEDFGIRAMRSRLQRVGATLTIVTAPGQGTTVRASGPYGLRMGFSGLGGRLRSWLRFHK
ncbi:MAG: ATP-binding protein [Acidobacteriota bacterium]